MNESLENIEHSTFNAQHSMNCRATFPSMFHVECSMLNVSSSLNGGWQ
jgi:hypothetical protein